jgi:transposase
VEVKDVLTVDDYGAIRRARRDGMSIRKIARAFHHSRYKIRQVLSQSEPLPYTRTPERPAPVLGPFQPIIDQILADDEHAPPKQRHTAMQVFRRLRDEHGYPGSYGQVQRYRLKHRRRHRETFIPLAHPPGHRLEADFGHIHVDFPDGRRLVPVLVPVWAYSNYPFVLALPTERTEAILAGLVAAFDFFACAPREVWWDNPRTVATLIFPGRQRQLHPRYAALASHYAFDPLFCLPAHSTEKPDAESTVKAVQRRFATPVPRVTDLDAINAQFRQLCRAEQERTVQSLSGPFLIAARFAEERTAAGRLPDRPFDACIVRPAVRVDKYQTVTFDNNRYSVPRAYAFQPVTVKGYVDRIVVVADGRVVASHPRCYGRCPPVLDPLHYLATLGRKPAALDHAPVYRDWKLPAAFTELRAALEERHGMLAGARQFIRVLELLRVHPQTRVERAIVACRGEQVTTVEAIVQRTPTLAAQDQERGGQEPCRCELATVPEIRVPRPDLSRFNQLLSGPGPGGAPGVERGDRGGEPRQEGGSSYDQNHIL